MSKEDKMLEEFRRITELYGIFPINGYDLEKMEERIAKESLKLGAINSGDRLLSLLNRQKILLERKRQKIEELKKVANEIEELRKSSFDLPPFLSSIYPSDFHRKNISLKELDAKPKRSDEGKVVETVVDIHSTPPLVRGFRVLKEVKVPIYIIFSSLFVIIAIALLYFKRFEWIDAGFCVAFGLISLAAFYDKLVWRYTQALLKPVQEPLFKGNVLNIPKETDYIEERGSDVVSNRLFGIPVVLADGTVLGHSKDFIIERNTMKFLSMKVETLQEMAEETGFNESIIPVQNTQIYLDQNNKVNIRVNAVYILGEAFLK